MKIRELNRKIFHNASQVTENDYLQMVTHCYQLGEGKGSNHEREARMETCVQKWRTVYEYLDSEQLLHAYSDFFRKTA